MAPTRRELIALGLSFLALPRGFAHEASHGHHPDAEEVALGSLADAELAFATTAAHEGRRAAIFAAAAPDAVLLRDRIVAVRDLGASAQDAAREQSQPAQIGVARSHDFGYASGSWRSGDARGAEDGVFLRLWRRKGRGPWRIVLGAMVRTPQPVDFVPLGAAPRPAYAGKADGGEARRQIARAEAALAAALRSRGAISNWLDRDLRCYRNGAMPLAGRTALACVAADAGVRTPEVPIAIHVASSADLAASYGAMRPVGRNASFAEGGYLHVWLRRRDGSWRLAFDVAPGAGRE